MSEKNEQSVASSVASKVVAITRELPSIGKSRVKIDGAKKDYNAFDANAVFAAVRPLMAEHGLMLIITDSAVDTHYVTYDMTWVDVDSDDRVEMQVTQPLIGGKFMGVSQQFNAADTYAIKRALRRMFLITDDTGNDEQRLADYDKPRDVPEYKGKQQTKPKKAAVITQITVDHLRTKDGKTQAVGKAADGKAGAIELGAGGLKVLAEWMSTTVDAITGVDEKQVTGLTIECRQLGNGLWAMTGKDAILTPPA